jgi:hypothetical protein
MIARFGDKSGNTFPTQVLTCSGADGTISASVFPQRNSLLFYGYEEGGPNIICFILGTRSEAEAIPKLSRGTAN